MKAPRPRPIRNEKVIGVLDIGSSKVACLIVALGGSGRGIDPLEHARVLGAGHVRSRGVKAGTLTDFEAAETAVRGAVAQAERAAGLTLDHVLVAVSCGRLQSHSFSAHADIGPHGVQDADINRAVAGGRAYVERDGRMLVHMNRIGYRLDGQPCGAHPRGMAARRFTADLHTITADETALRNMSMLLERCYLHTDGVIAAPFASGLSASTVEERKLGVTVVDMGGGVMTLSMFVDGKLVFVDAAAVGGSHLTFDVARGLQTPLAEAERIKALYGTMTGAQSDSYEAFSYPLADDPQGLHAQASKADLASIMAPRLRALLGDVAKRIDASGLRAYGGERLVLTGGAAQLVGIGGLAADVLGRPARIGLPAQLAGLPESMKGSSFATLTGLVLVAAGGRKDAGGLVRVRDPSAVNQGYFERVGHWLMGTG